MKRCIIGNLCSGISWEANDGGAISDVDCSVTALKMKAEFSSELLVSTNKLTWPLIQGTIV